MKQSEAKEQMRKIWFGREDRCSKEIMYGMTFYNIILKDYRHLLDFRFSGDQYQIVKTWVHEWQRVYCDAD